MNGKIIKLLKRSCGIRDIAFIQDISTTTVLHKIRTIAEKVMPPISFPFNSDYEMDEMHTLVWKDNVKTETYIAYAIHKQSKTVVNFTVGTRDSLTLGKTINKILSNDPKTIRTDKWSAYPSIIPDRLHISSRRKINQIERYNLTLRTHLKRLGHNRLCQSKTKEMLESCLKIYFWG
jgi:IS1 family transposase